MPSIHQLHTLTRLDAPGYHGLMSLDHTAPERALSSPAAPGAGESSTSRRK